MFVVAAALLAAVVAPIMNGNALTLPAARHVARLDPQNGRPATWLLALQQDGASGHMLGWYRSDDEAQSWSYYAPIQDDSSERDTVDLLQVGLDLAVVYSYEGPTISGSALHDVWFQWWRWDGASDWVPSARVRVFDSTSDSIGYLPRRARARLGRAAPGFGAADHYARRHFTMVMLPVSTDGGVTWPCSSRRSTTVLESARRAHRQRFPATRMMLHLF